MILIKFIAVGILGSLALIFLAKVIMAGLLQRNGDYYRDRFDEFDLAEQPDKGGGADA